MNTTTRYAIAVLLAIFALHSLLSLTHEPYGRATSLAGLASALRPAPPSAPPPASSPKRVPAQYVFDLAGDAVPPGPRANATLLMLARNSDVAGAVSSVRELEDRFNRKFRYPWTFMNEEPFSDEFKKRVSVLLQSPAEFIEIPKEHWVQPEWIDEKKAEAGRQELVDANVIYGGSVPYRNMCRFNSGFFFKQPALQKYRWYWRVEPDVHFHCNVDFDPFRVMQENNKTYGFTITMYEFQKTIPTLWETTKKFIREHPQYVARDNLMPFISDDGGDTFSLCHFWSNFEVADMEFWRSPAYTAYFEALEKTGGFYYERWGDAPVHSIAAALFLQRDQVQFFDEIGYEHNPYTHCPQGEETWKAAGCSCERARSFDYDGYSCMRKWDKVTS